MWVPSSEGVRSGWGAARVGGRADGRIPRAVCPTSNRRRGVGASLDDHPLRELWRVGVIVSVHTDDPGFFDCDLVGEYAISGRLLELDRAGYARLARNSVDGSFAPDEVRAQLRSAIADWEGRGD